MRIDFIADVVCPWCWLGWLRLHRALAMRPAVSAEVLWRAYQLDPTIPEEGLDRATYMARKFPDPERLRAMGEMLAAEAVRDGATLNYDRIVRSPNTNAAHRVIRWAQGQGRQADAALALFSAYFAEGRDIGDPEVLADCAEAAGLDRTVVLGLLAQDADKASVAQEHAAAVEAGVTGVPFVVINGRLAVAGAQEPERFVLAIDKALKLAA
jgi:predicted DsbA family dithiol-disulfide isomerase